MSNERSKTAVIENADAPSNPYNTFLHMEILCERLKMLKFEKEFYRGRHQKPIPRHYFAIPTNPGEQFHTFTTLAAWLISKVNGKIEPPQEYDDPNATIATILDAVRVLGHSVEFAPSKLKTGCGDCCIQVLRMLAESALKQKNHKFSLPHYPDETTKDVAVEEEELSSKDDDDDCEWNGQYYGGRSSSNRGGLSEVEAEDDCEEDTDVPNLEALKARGSKPKSLSPSGTSRTSPKMNTPSQDETLNTLAEDEWRPRVTLPVLESTADPADWQLEVERVLPHLRVTVRADSKDWRVHQEEMHKHRSEIDRIQSECRTQLSRLQTELGRALDKISSREKYMNGQLEPILLEFKSTQDKFKEVNDKYGKASGGITERSRKLADVTEELERVKVEMGERGSSMTDGSPVVRIKQAIQRLRQEMAGMDIRVGVLEHILLRTHLRLREDSQKPLFTKQQHDKTNAGSSPFVY